MLYTNRDSISIKLPEGIPKRFSLKYLEEFPNASEEVILAAWKVEIDNIIQDCSCEIDERVGAKYPLNYNSGTQCFPDYPDTPRTISKICKYLSLEMCVEWYGESYYRPSESERSYRELANDLIQQIQEEKIKLKIAHSSVAGGGTIDRERVFVPGLLEEL